MLVLALKTWPFIRPMLGHLLVYLVLGAAGGTLFGLGGALVTDVFNNKILVGEKLQPVQAALLGLDSRYVPADFDGAIGDVESGPGDTSDGTGDDDGPATEDPSDIERLTAEQRRTVRNRLIIWGAVVGVLASAALAALPYYGRWIWHNVNQNLRVAMLSNSEHLSLRFHSRSRVGDAIYRVYRDSAMIISLVEECLIAPIQMLYGLIVSFAFIAFFDPWVAASCLLVFLPVIGVTAWFTPRIRQRAAANREANSRLTSQLQETFSAIKVAKFNRAESLLFQRFNHDSRAALDAAFYLRLEIVALVLTVTILGGMLFFALEYVMATWVIEGRETALGALVAAFIGFTVWNLGAFQSARGQVEGSAGTAVALVGTWSTMQDLFIGLERAFFLLDLKPEVEDPPHPTPFPGEVRRVVWDNVHFAYQSRPVLGGVGLVAEAGTVTAIIGPTGSGKSTLMSLLLRLYDPDSGRVLINDADLREFSIEDLRAHVAIALQRNVLFAGSVADNIRYAAQDKSLAEVEAAAQVSTADAFVRELPDGYDTELGERGGKLSTGQRQRLSIARAVIRDTPILILDEPTASLDARTEHEMLRNLAEWGRERVVFIVTHRLSTIRNANRIAVLDDMRIVEHGTHDELMQVDGPYRRFVEAESEGSVQASDDV